MDRGASAAFLAELVKTKNQPFHLFELYLDSGTIYATDASRNIEWNGHTYLALSHFLEFSGIRETTELQVSLCSIALSGVDQSMISAVLNEDYLDRRLVIYRGFLSEDVWLDLPGSFGNYASTPDSSAVSITADIDVRLHIRPDDWTPLNNYTLASKYLTAGSRSYSFRLFTSGTIGLVLTDDGTNADHNTFSSVTISSIFSNGQAGWVRFTAQFGGGNVTVRYWYSTDGVSWTQLGVDRVSVLAPIFDSAAPLAVGAGHTGTGLFPFRGRIYRAQAYNGVNGALISDFDPSRFGVGGLSATMPTGEDWTVHQATGSPPNDVARINHDDHRVVVDPIAIFDGRIDEPTIIEDVPADTNGGTITSTVSIDAASHWGDFERRPGRHTNHEEQQIYFSGDKFFEFVSELGKPVIWGRGTGASTPAAPRGAPASEGSDRFKGKTNTGGRRSQNAIDHGGH